MLLWHGQFPFCHSLMFKKFVSHPNHSIRVCVKGKRSNRGAEYGLEIPTEHCKCPYSGLSAPYFPVFGLKSISPYSVRMRENADQNNFEYGHFSRSGVNISWQ